MKVLAAAIVAIIMALSVAGQASATGCFEPCPDGEVYSDDAEMCVDRNEAST